MQDPLYEAFVEDSLWRFCSFEEFKQAFKTIENYEKTKPHD